MTDERQTTTAAEPSTEGDTETPTAPEPAAAAGAVATEEAPPLAAAENADDGEPETAAAEPEDGTEDGAEAEQAAQAADGEGEPVAEAEPEAPAEVPAAQAEAAAGTAEETATDAVEADEPPAAEEPRAEAAAEPQATAPASAEATAEGEMDADDDEGDGDGAEDEATAAELDDPNLIALRDAKESGATVTGKVIGWNRGGFHVVTHEITAFCPSSEMELGRPRSPSGYLDRELEFKVVKFQRRGRRVVLSRTALLDEHRKQVLDDLKPGAVVQGTITSLPDFGAFVDLGGVEGLVHVSEISRSRVKRPKDALKLGQQVEVKVLKIEDKGDRISLSMKELEPDPWKGVAERYPRGSQFTGKILRHADFGLFVELEPDVEGLVHVSQLAPGQEMNAEALKPGSTIEGWVREVEAKRQRISLTLREVPDDDPWKTVGERFPEGEMTDGTVESIAPFGVFINLAPGLTGLLPNSQTGLPRGTNAARAFTPGQQVKIQVLQIDTRRKRISLGKEGSQVEATKADLQEYKKQAREQEKEAPGAMAAAFARLREGN